MPKKEKILTNILKSPITIFILVAILVICLIVSYNIGAMNTKYVCWDGSVKYDLKWCPEQPKPKGAIIVTDCAWNRLKHADLTLYTDYLEIKCAFTNTGDSPGQNCTNVWLYGGSPNNRIWTQNVCSGILYPNQTEEHILKIYNDEAYYTQYNSLGFCPSALDMYCNVLIIS